MACRPLPKITAHPTFAKLEDQSIFARVTIYVKICNNKFTKSSRKTGLSLELPPYGFISQWVMPENQIPATQPDPGAAPGEFDFAKPVTENPRIKRRSLKAKGSTLKPAGSPAAEAPEPVIETPTAAARQDVQSRPQPAEKPKLQTVKSSAPANPVRTAPTAAAAARPASTSAAVRSTVTPSSSTTTSPHGTRPATLYYSSQPRKAETPAPQKPIPAESAAASSPTPATTVTPMPTSFSRPAAAGQTAATRPATTVDYRANVERQSREQKSVGNILAYAVYALIAFFVLSAGLAIYGADVIFQRLHDQGQTVADLDTRYAAENAKLKSELAIAAQVQTDDHAQIVRQQDLIVKQQEQLSKLIASINDNAAAIKAEKQARTQETSNLRGQVRDLQGRGTTKNY
jgi:hypothetical protein